MRLISPADNVEARANRFSCSTLPSTHTTITITTTMSRHLVYSTHWHVSSLTRSGHMMLTGLQMCFKKINKPFSSFDSCVNARGPDIAMNWKIFGSFLIPWTAQWFWETEVRKICQNGGRRYTASLPPLCLSFLINHIVICHFCQAAGP